MPEQLSAFLPVAAAVSALIALAALIGLAALRGRLRETRAELSELSALRDELARLRYQAERMPALESELTEARAESAENARARASAEAEAKALREERETRTKELAELRARLDSEAETRAGAQRELAALKQSHEARLEELRAMKAELEKTFRQAASGALDQNAKNFLQLVSERFEQHKATAEEDLAKRQKAIENLMKPIQENLGKFEARVGEIEKARNDAYGAIRQQVETLAQGQQRLTSETGKLVQALRAPKTRGRWGEFQLRQVFEMAGMSEHVDFLTEHSFETDAGRRRPDALVRLPGGKSVVVDAKTPLDAYLTALEATDPAAQAEALGNHARQLKAHVRMLSSKEYWNALPEAPDFVVMFVPGEAFYSAAVEQDPTLFETALEARVLVCSPTTLIALVKSIAYGWQQEKLAQNAQEVAGQARELYNRLSTFGGHMDGLGRGLRQAVDRYNKAVGALESRVLPSARRFESLGVLAEGSRIEEPAPVDHEPRALSASEFTEDDS
ncbi:MAG: DNA recombination protein RmuC [Pseudomonadota bacterium]